MTLKVKQAVKNQISTNYGKEMIEIHGLNYVKKEIFHAVKNQDGDKRKFNN